MKRTTHLCVLCKVVLKGCMFILVLEKLLSLFVVDIYVRNSVVSLIL